MNSFEKIPGRSSDLPYHGGWKAEAMAGKLPAKDKESAREVMRGRRKDPNPHIPERKNLTRSVAENIIGDSNRFLKEEFQQLGLDKYFEPTSSGKVFVDTEIRSSAAEYSPIMDTIGLPVDSEPDMLMRAIHEIIHRLGAIKLKAETTRAGKVEPGGGRLGYDLFARDARGRLNTGFNEGIVQLIAQRIFYRHKKEIRARYTQYDDSDELDAAATTYRVAEREFIQTLIEKMARLGGGTPKSIFHEFEMGHFTGDMMHLRKIEDIFGTGALDVLSEYGLQYETRRSEEGHPSGDDSMIIHSRLFPVNHERFMAFFQAPTVAERDMIAKEILSWTGYERYYKRRNKSVERRNALREEVGSVPAKIASTKSRITAIEEELGALARDDSNDSSGGGLVARLLKRFEKEDPKRQASKEAREKLQREKRELTDSIRVLQNQSTRYAPLLNRRMGPNKK